MKDQLDIESRQALIQYRLQRAEETLEESAILADAKHYNAAMNRLYYACYYAVVAALLRYGVNASTHSGVKTMFGLHFIVKQRLSNEHGKTFNRLFEIRHSGDYDDFVYCDEDMVKEYTPKAQNLIFDIQQLLSPSLSK